MAALFDVNTHPEVKDFLDNQNPTKEQIITAYNIRDASLNLDYDEHFNKCITKLGLHPGTYEDMIDYRFKQIMHERIDEFLADKSNPIVCLDYESFRINLLKTTFENKLDKYDKILNYYDTNNEFYSQLTIEDLISLGW